MVRPCDSLADELRCDEDAGESWYEVSHVVRDADHDVFSLEVHASYYCGAAHPMNDADSSLTFDLVTAEAVRFRELFADYERDEVEIVGAYLRHLGAEDLEGCEDVLTPDGLLGHYFACTVSEEGLRMRSSFPHVLEMCNTTSVVPVGELRTVAPPGDLLERLARIQGD